jgi:hypothetical protein
MSGRNVRQFLLLAALGGIGWWIHEKRPTVSGLVDDLTRPLMGSQAVVKESEQKRVVSEASQVVLHDEEKPVAALREGMSDLEVRALLGDPDEILPDGDSALRLRWVYRKVDRVVVFDRHRVVSIAIR